MLKNRAHFADAQMGLSKLQGRQHKLGAKPAHHNAAKGVVKRNLNPGCRHRLPCALLHSNNAFFRFLPARAFNAKLKAQSRDQATQAKVIALPEQQVQMKKAGLTAKTYTAGLAWHHFH